MAESMRFLSRVRSLPQKLRNRYGVWQYIEEYVPQSFVQPARMIKVGTAWKGLEGIIADILERFEVGRQSCIEFGVEFGYSTVAFSNYFDTVVGVDTFAGDQNTKDKRDHFVHTSQVLAQYPNIKLQKSNYQDWIGQDKAHYDMAHVDIVHTYKDTYRCGLWAAQHSDVTLFHDTESFLDVRNAAIDIATITGKRIYNYPHCYGLGIVAPG